MLPMIPDTYINVISAMYENNIATIRVGNEVSSWFCIKLEVKQGCALSSFIWFILMDFVLRNTGKTVGEHKIKWRRKTFLDSDYAHYLSILNESVIKINELTELLRVRRARIVLTYYCNED